MAVRFDDIPSMLTYWRDQAPDRPALWHESEGGPKAMSFAELAEAVDRRSAAIRAEGARCLGMLCESTSECVIELFAAASAGVRLVLLDAMAPEALLEAQVRRTRMDRLWGDEELIEVLSPALAPPCPGPDSDEVLFFTSGTTESAKAVVLTQRSLCASAWNGSALLPLKPEDRLMCMLPLNHVFGFVCGLMWALSCGASVALGRGARHYADDCAYYRPTALSAVPLLLGFLIGHDALNPELSLILVGAGDCPPQLLKAAKAGGRRVSFGYGLTETSSGVALSLGDDPLAMTVCPEDRITIAPDGEILIDAPTTVMKGYLDAPEDTARALEGGWLHTGDLGRMDDEGRLYVTGRKKEVLVLRDGTKLFLPEYEGRLAPLLPGRDFAAATREGRPVLVVAGREDERESISKAVAPAMAQLPRGQQIFDIMIISGPLPRTATGKVRRWELQQKVGTP